MVLKVCRFVVKASSWHLSCLFCWICMWLLPLSSLRLHSCYPFPIWRRRINGFEWGIWVYLEKANEATDVLRIGFLAIIIDWHQWTKHFVSLLFNMAYIWEYLTSVIILRTNLETLNSRSIYYFSFVGIHLTWSIFYVT